MIPPFRELLNQAGRSIREPREELRKILAYDLSRRTRWEILVLLTLATVIVTVLHHFALFGEALFLVVVDDLGRRLLEITPYIAAIAAVSGSVISVFLIYWCGRAFKGTGTFPDAILAMGWMQFILLCMGVLQAVISLVIPALSDMIGVAAMVITLWIFCQFVAELHGFKSAARVLMATIAITFGFLMAFIFVADAFDAAVGNI